MISERAEILKALEAGPLILRRLVRDLPDETIRRRPAEGEWAIVEVVAHLADTEERTLDRTRRMLSEEEPFLEPYDPDALAIERAYLGMDMAARARSVRGATRGAGVAPGRSWAIRAGSGPASTGSMAGSRSNSSRPTRPARTRITSPRSLG